MERQTVDIGKIAEAVWRFRYMSAAIVLGTVALALAFIWLSTPVYRAEVLLAAVNYEDSQGSVTALGGQLGGIAALAGVGAGTPDKKDEAIAVLKSRHFTRKFIESENLMPVLFPSRWDPDANEWRSKDADDVPTISDAVQIFGEDIRSVQEDKTTELVTLRIDWHNREAAAKWANLLVQRLNEHLRERDIQEAQESIEYLNQELEKTTVIEIQQGIFRLIEQQIEAKMLANVRAEYAFRILDPASIPDADDYASPNERLILLVALFVGGMIAVFLAALRISSSDD